MTLEQQNQVDGFRAHLAVAGYEFTSDGDDEFNALVEDNPQLPEPYKTSQKKTPVYAIVTAIRADLKDVRAVGVITEVEDLQRAYRIIEVLPRSDVAFVAWLCEVQRL